MSIHGILLLLSLIASAAWADQPVSKYAPLGARSKKPPSECFLIMRQVLHGREASPGDQESDYRFMKEVIEKDLFQFRELGKEKPLDVTVAHNRQVIELASRPSQLPVRNGRKSAINARTAQEIFDKIGSHPVASLAQLDRYDSNPDPKEKIGFCFGRAMAVHLDALARGVDRSRIRKLWAFGSFRDPQGGISWRYHVATVIQAEEGGWWAIDPVMGRPMKIDDWHERMAILDPDYKMQLYLTEAGRFNPNTANGYNRWVLMKEEFNDYYKDLLKVFREEARRRQREKIQKKDPGPAR